MPARSARKVTAFDASPIMVELARARLGGRARVDRAVLGDPLPYPDQAFDRVVCALAIHYARDRAAAFAEFFRVLRPGGAAVVSTQHPVMDWLRKGGSYFATTLETDTWNTPRGEQPVRFWREPLSALCEAAPARASSSRPSSNLCPPNPCASDTPTTTTSSPPNPAS
jgi:SAM-dependent methyltransferase